MEIDDVLVKRPGGMLKMPKSVFEKLLSEMRHLRKQLGKVEGLERSLNKTNAHLESIRHRLKEIPPSNLSKEE